MSADLTTLAELAGEGLGWDGAYVRQPRDAVDALAAQLRGQVVVDDIGRRAVPRAVARRLLSERATAEQRQRDAVEQQDAEFERHRTARLVGGMAAADVPAGMTPAEAMVMAGERDTAPRRRQSVLEDALQGGGLTFRPIVGGEEGA